jgi:mannose-1-phosphate guanylyltransferase
VALSAFHMADVLRANTRMFKRFGVEVVVVEEKSPLGTGGAIRFAWLDPKKPTLALNGDALSDFDFRLMIADHRKRKAHATLWVRPVEDVSRFGVVEHGADCKVTRFLEKPKPGQTRCRSINAGAYLLEPQVRELIPEGRPVSIERETFPSLLSDDLRVFVCAQQPKAYWRDIGTPEEYLAANMDACQGRLAFYQKGSALWPKGGKKGVIVASGCKVHPSAKLEGVVLGKGCVIGPEAVLKDCVLWQGCRIGQGARLEGALLGQNVVLGQHAQLRPGAVLGNGAMVPDYSIA